MRPGYGFPWETKELKDMEGRIRGDIWYLEHWSFGLDLYIMYRTVANVFRGEKMPISKRAVLNDTSR